MSEVKRYECTDTSRDYMHSCGMEEDSLGDYVLHSDYEKLKAQLEKAEKVLNYIAEGNDHWAEAEQIAAREYFKEKELK